LKSFCFGLWLLNGDFNLIYLVKDKNNDRLNPHLMVQFHRFLNDVCLKEIHLNGWLFTWSNQRQHPNLERIDCAFVSRKWDELFLHHDLHSLASLCSNHAPFLLRTYNMFSYYKRFHIRSWWPHFLGFMEVVCQASICPLRDTDPC
jgi:hypothetical protein